MVKVGEINNPENLRQAAHLTEHLVFQLKSKNSSNKKEYTNITQFCNENSIDYNAETHIQFTSYHFKIPENIYEEFLELFFEVISLPEFTKDNITYEINNVNSEYADQNIDKLNLEIEFFKKT